LADNLLFLHKLNQNNMKKFYISFSLVTSLLIGHQGLAQTAITLSATYLPQVGSLYIMGNDTTPTDMPSFTVTAGSASAQNWNYGSSVFGNVYIDTLSFVAPTGNPGASSFPNSNLASDQGGGSWGYLIKGSNGLYVDGAYITVQGISAALDFTPNAPQIPVPFTYNGSTTVAYTATATATYQSLPLLIKHRANRTITADAFGAITTPAATYSNTLRVKMYEITSDSVFLNLGFGSPSFQQAIYDTTTNYSWYQNAQSALVMSIDQTTSGNTTKARYLQTSTLSGINNIKQGDFSTNLYPNPTNSITYLNYENAASSKVSASICDITGRQVTSLLNNREQAAGKQTLAIDASNLPTGLYMIQLTINGVAKTLKLNVQ
jgi:hypothetical protein